MRAQAGQSGSRRWTQSARGFSLIELLIVVAVILTIMAIAIPNFIRSRMRANEAGAVQSLRNITTAEVVYSTTYGIGYSTSLAKLGGNAVIVDANNAGLIDDVLAQGAKSGYKFTYTAGATDANGNVVDYFVNADPISVGVTGMRFFYADQTGVIHQNQTSQAGPNDPPI